MRKVVLTATAAKDLLRLPGEIGAEMRALIADFAAGKPVDASRLRGREGQVRLRRGDYRVIVTVTRAEVTVLRVRHRSIVYRP